MLGVKHIEGHLDYLTKGKRVKWNGNETRRCWESWRQNTLRGYVWSVLASLNIVYLLKWYAVLLSFSHESSLLQISRLLYQYGGGGVSISFETFFLVASLHMRITWEIVLSMCIPIGCVLWNDISLLHYTAAHSHTHTNTCHRLSCAQTNDDKIKFKYSAKCGIRVYLLPKNTDLQIADSYINMSIGRQIQ